MDITTVGTVSEDAGTFVHFKDVTGALLFDGEAPAEGQADTRTPVGAKVAGTYSERYRKAQKKVKEQNIKAMRRNEDFDGDALDERTFVLEAACIIEWTFTANGQPFPVTVENYKALVAKQPQWQEQVDKAMHDHARFFRGELTALMAVIAHEATLARPTKDGAGSRAHLLNAAKRGHAVSIAALRSPPFPEALDYLYEWFRELGAGRGEGFHGPAPLTHQGIAAWAQLTDRAPEPHEVDGLLALDAAWRSALRGDPVQAEREAEVVTPAWPTKRGP
jgi:hypothetical protein